MDDYSNLIKRSLDLKSKKDDRYKELSRDRLVKIAAKKIQTTMIGALSSIEKTFGFLWEHNDDIDLTEEQQHMKDLYENMRSEILDRGNSQIRNLEAELSHYDITWKRYQVTLPIKVENKEED